MQIQKWFPIILASLAIPTLAYADDPQSDTVSSSVLEANFAVFQSDTPNMAQVVVQLAEAKVIEGVEFNISLTQSADDIVTVSNGTTTITYDPKNTSSSGNLLPYNSNAEYQITFKRFNGEVYHSTIKLPTPIVYTQPAPYSVFKKSDPVDIIWQPIIADQLVGEMEMDGNCKSWGDSELGDNSLHLDSDFTSTCTGPVSFTLTLFATNFGKGYGLNWGMTQNALPFSYEDSKLMTKRLTTREKVLRILNSHLGPHALIKIKH